MRSAIFLLGLAGCACAADCQGAAPTVDAGKDATAPAKTPSARGSVVSTGENSAALIAALKAASNEEAKLAVVRKLVARDENGVREALQAAVDRERDEEVKSHIVVEIAKGSSPQIMELLIAIYRKGDHSLFCGPAALALAKVPGDKMAGVLAEGLKRQYTECAAASVADALRTRKEKVVSDALLASLDDFEPTWLTARAHVCSALGGRSDPRITAVLLDNLQNADDEGVKEACAEPCRWRATTRSLRPSSRRSRLPTNFCCAMGRR